MTTILCSGSHCSSGVFSRSRIPLRGKTSRWCGAEGIENGALTARDGRERRLVDRREMVVLRERVDCQLPVDRAVEHLLTQRRPSPDAPGFQLVGQWSQERRDVEGCIAVQRYPQETRALGGR